MRPSTICVGVYEGQEVRGKPCTVCKTHKPLDHFPTRGRSKWSGNVIISPHCKPCTYVNNRAWQAKNKAKIRDTAFYRNYGITLDEYNAILASQGGVCAICKGVEIVAIEYRTGVPRNLAVDHCHSTGTIRGILCSSCNQGIGHFRDSAEILAAAAEYLAKHQRTNSS
jgi:hypothetical protein